MEKNKEANKVSIKKILIDMMIIITAISFLLEQLIFKSKQTAEVLFIILIILTSLELLITMAKNTYKEKNIGLKIFNIVGSLVNVTLLFSIFMNILMEKEEKIYELLITIGSLIVIALTLFYSIRALVRLIKNKNNLFNNVGTSLIGIMDVVALIMCIIKILI